MTATEEYRTENSNEKPAPVPVIVSTLQRAQSEIDYEDARATRHEQRDHKRLIVEGCGLVIAIVLAAATIGLWIVTLKSTRIAGVAARAAQEGAKAAAAQADATKQSIEATVAQFRLDQRAWIAVTTVDLAIPRANEILRAQAQIANTGKTPAFDVTVVIGGIQTNYGELDVDAWIRSGKAKKPKQPGFTGVIFPSSSQKLPFATDQPLTDRQAAEVENNTLWVYVFGDVRYRDAFGQHHLTKFCAVYEPVTKGFNICGRHSYAD